MREYTHIANKSNVVMLLPKLNMHGDQNELKHVCIV